MKKLLDYLYNLNPGTKFGLETTQQMLNALGNPEKQFKSIHIAGTNGKGSIAVFLQQILRQSYNKIGLYTSPHLVRFNERIRINDREIKNQELVKLTREIKAVVKKKQLNPTFFEFTTVLTFLYFARKKVDYAVIETGMGGRLDSTNVIKPELSIITNIALDHQSFLGHTLTKIAREKAAIIKEKVPLVTGEKRKNLLKIFQAKGKEKKAPILLTDKLIQGKLIRSNLQGQTFQTQGKINSTFRINLLGEHQVDNALTSIITAQQLGFPLAKIKKGLTQARWPGRLEIVSKKPLVIVDGAHNVAGMKKLKQFLTNLPQRKILVLGTSKDKEIKKMVSLIAPLADEVILTQGNFKPASLSSLEREVKKYGRKNKQKGDEAPKIKKCPQVKEALKQAGKLAQPNDLILITGSIYLIGDVLSYRSLFDKIFKG